MLISEAEQASGWGQGPDVQDPVARVGGGPGGVEMVKEAGMGASST